MAGKCPTELEEQFITDCALMDTSDLCEKYDRAPSTIKEWRMNLFHAGRLLWWPGIQVGEVKEYTDQIEIEDDAIILGDLEIPYHDPEVLGYAVSVGKRFGITTLVIAGDFLANDAVGFWPAEDTDESQNYSLADSLLDGKLVLQSLFEYFKRIILIKGNHEQRATRVREWGFFQMMQQEWEELGDLEISFYKWCVVQGCRIEHFGNYSKIPGSVARERAEIEGCSVAGGHTHHLSMSFSKSGDNIAIDLGHCTRPKTRYYKQVNGTTRHPKWIAGFWMLRNGYWYPFPKEFTDWAFWLNREKGGN